MKFGRKHFLREEAGTEAGGAGGSSTGEAGTAHENINQASGTQDGGESGTQNQDTSEGNQESGTFDLSKLDSSVQDYIKELRAENAKTRTERNNLSTRMENFENGFKQMFGDEGEGQELTPEQQIESLNTNFQDLSFSNAVMGIAYQNDVPHDKLEYFEFLMNKEVEGLEEGQELSEESLAGLIQKVKGSGFQGEANSSVNEGNAAGKDPNASGATNLDAFVGMSLQERSELYRKDPNTYNALYKQAREKRLL